MALLPAAALGTELGMGLPLASLKAFQGGFCPRSAAAWCESGVGEDVVF